METAPETRGGMLKRVQELLAAVHDYRPSRDESVEKDRPQLFEELNKLLPAMDIDSLTRQDYPGGIYIFDKIISSDPPLSTLVVLIGCGLDLDDTDVLIDVMYTWVFKDEDSRHSVDTDEVVQLLIASGGNVSTIFGQLLANNAESHVKSLLSIVNNNLQTIDELFNSVSLFIVKPGAVNAIFEVLKQLDCHSRTVFKNKAPFPLFPSLVMYRFTEDVKLPDVLKLLFNDYKFKVDFKVLSLMIRADCYVPDRNLLNITLNCCELDLEEMQNQNTILELAIQENYHQQAATLIKAGAQMSNVRKVERIIKNQLSGFVEMAKLMTFLGFPAHHYFQLTHSNYCVSTRETVDVFKIWLAEFKVKPRTLFEMATIKLRNLLTMKQIQKLIADGQLPSNILANRIFLLEQFEEPEF